MNTKKLVTTALIIAMGVVSNSIFVIPIGIAKVAPMQHLLNVLTAVWLGPGYAVLQAFGVSVLRNLLGTGTVFAFPGSMIGAICAGLFYARTQKLGYAALGEWIGTGILGSLASTLLAQFFMGMEAALMLFCRASRSVPPSERVWLISSSWKWEKEACWTGTERKKRLLYKLTKKQPEREPVVFLPFSEI
ncbi:energy coupling factor transporter S component ThiW [Trichococcus shcherbakoviae]|uniref:energy coupling factor transporter S component ThiW n=1 Tax=Trichococcus shcherbakoviae TaxID=2094020 RepID=UPI002AA92563|nr:energy coupling factor transporter S component ThiW [Trichococcus shcherbakoviae]